MSYLAVDLAIHTVDGHLTVELPLCLVMNKNIIIILIKLIALLIPFVNAEDRFGKLDLLLVIFVGTAPKLKAGRAKKNIRGR